MSCEQYKSLKFWGNNWKKNSCFGFGTEQEASNSWREKNQLNQIWNKEVEKDELLPFN